MTGPCAKKVVRCTIVTRDGQRFTGENSCGNPQTECPRLPGEGYEKCKSVCEQPYHAEMAALAKMDMHHQVMGAKAYVQGIDFVCEKCQQGLFFWGIESVQIGEPPA